MQAFICYFKFTLTTNIVAYVICNTLLYLDIVICIMFSSEIA